MLSVKPLKGKRREEREEVNKRNSTFGLCLILTSTSFREEERGTGFLVENLVLTERIPPHDFLVTSDKVIEDVGESTKNYILRFRKSVKSGKLKDIPLSEIAASSKPYKPPGDTSGIIFICLNSESKTFQKVLKGRLFSIVEDDSQNDENLYCFFVDVSSKNFVKSLCIYKQDGSGKYTVEESGSFYTSYESLKKNPSHRPFGGAILKEVRGEHKCVGMLNFTDDETKTLSPVFFSTIRRRGALQTVQADTPQGNEPNMSDDKTMKKEKEELAQRIKEDLSDLESGVESGIDSLEEDESDDDKDQGEAVPLQREKKPKNRSQRPRKRANTRNKEPSKASSEEENHDDTNLSREIIDKIHPPTGSLKGGTQFLMVLHDAVPEDVISFQAKFEDCEVVNLTQKNPFNLVGVTPCSKHMGIKKVILHFGTAKGSQIVGSTSFRYDDPEGFAQLVSDQATRLAFFDIMAMDEVNESTTAWSVKVLQLLVRTAVRIGCQEFIEIISCTEAAHAMLNSFKTRNKSPEDVARDNGFKEMAHHIQRTRERLSKEGDTKTELVRWSNIRVAATEHHSAVHSMHQWESDSQGGGFANDEESLE